VILGFEERYDRSCSGHTVAGGARHPSPVASAAKCEQNRCRSRRNLSGFRPASLSREVTLAKTIVVTGSSTGLGFGAARAFAERGYRVIATVRSEDDAGRVQAAGKGNIHPVICDVTRQEQVAELPDCVRKHTVDGILHGLINNAGIMLAPGPVEFQKMENIRAQFDVNVFGMMAVTIALLPLLGTGDAAKRHAGRIINMSSIEGKLASPFISAYAATKSAIEGFSHSLRRELRLFGIKVIIVGPGGVKSEMWRKNRLDIAPLVGTAYEASFRKLVKITAKMENDAATPEEVGGFLVRVFEAPRPKARYAYSHKPLVDGTWPSMFPDLWYDEMLGMLLGLKQRSVSDP
jgi:NAD(P)-dependent dehydrogenase (short-subunit alcohol dehydrogenase family)